MIEAIGQLSTELQTDELYAAYSVALTKKAMETQAASAEALMAEMLPAANYSVPQSAPMTPAVTEAHYIDTYA